VIRCGCHPLILLYCINICILACVVSCFAIYISSSCLRLNYKTTWHGQELLFLLIKYIHLSSCPTVKAVGYSPRSTTIIVLRDKLFGEIRAEPLLKTNIIGLNQTLLHNWHNQGIYTYLSGLVLVT